MIFILDVEKSGDEFKLKVPKELADQLQLDESKAVILRTDGETHTLAAKDSKVAGQLKVMLDVMNRYDGTLAALAKS
jgi:hypothetical protein